MTEQAIADRALVVLSGGQDSATCLAIAQHQHDEINTLSFMYGQKHSKELFYAKQLSEIAGSKDHKVLVVNQFKEIAQSSLLNHETPIDVPHINNEELPASFVPGRNFIFLGYAAIYAYTLGIHDIYTGVCQADFSGYPDCRSDTIDSIEKSLSLALDTHIKIHAPLMDMTKAEIVVTMYDLGKLDWYGATWTCYEGGTYPCGECPSCKLRAKGFAEAGLEDPFLVEEE